MGALNAPFRAKLIVHKYCGIFICKKNYSNKVGWYCDFHKKFYKKLGYPDVQSIHLRV